MKQIVSVLFLFLIVSVWSVDQAGVASKANKAYEQKQFQQALSLYQSLEESGVRNADLFYNMGNCYYRLQNMGHAVLYYKRALRIDSAHTSAQHNLQLALSNTRDQQYQANESFVINLAGRMMNILTLNRLAVMLLISLLLVVGLLIYLWRSQNKEERLLPFFALILALVLLLTTGVVSIVKYHQFLSHKQAVLVQGSEGGFSGPGTDYTRVFTIHEGMIVLVNKEEDGWSQIQLPNGLGGWIPSASIIRINP